MTTDAKKEKCKECGGTVCICSDYFDGKRHWAAHCMVCNNSIGEDGFYNPCADSREAAIAMWNKLNGTQSEVIDDEFGNAWSSRCPECGNNTMQIIRPGKCQCSVCG